MKKKTTIPKKKMGKKEIKMMRKKATIPKKKANLLKEKNAKRKKKAIPQIQ